MAAPSNAVFQAEGTMTTTVDGTVYLQPGNGM
jgi:hypothetical protein